MIYIGRSQIIRINRMTVEHHGGNFVPPDNLLHPDVLDYVVEAVDAEMFGEPLYPSVIEKSEVYFFSIISNHIFQDGNKRTGLEVMLSFLDENGYDISHDLPNIRLTEFVIQVAAGQLTLEQVTEWLTANTVRR